MGARDTLPLALEDLNAMILAVDLGDPHSTARLSARVEDILSTLQPTSPETELLSLVLTTLQCGLSQQSGEVLRVVATAIAELSEHSAGDSAADAASLERVAQVLRRIKQSGSDTISISGAGSTNAISNADTVSDWTAIAPANEHLSSMIEVDAQLLAEFTAESYDRIALAEAATLALESNPHDTEAINTVLRAFHTIKGASGLLGLTTIQHLAHHAESLLIRGRDGELQMVGRHIDLALQSCDALKFMIDGMENQPPGHIPAAPANYDALLNALSEHERSGETPSTTVTATADHAPRAVTQAAADDDNASAKLDRSTDSTVDQTGAAAAEVLTDESPSSSRISASTSAVSGVEASVRVNTQRLDNLVNLVGELVIAQSIVTQDTRAVDDGTSRLARSVSAAGKITRQLQDLAMSLRMVPLKGTFQKMARLVRDMAHKSDKAVQFHMSGEDTEIDRNMVEVLNDPLAHMIRNAVDHGIERSADRLACGKNPTGSLHLRAYHAAGNVVIELEDDGKGLNRDRILKQAIQRGVVDKDKNLSDEEVHFLIFHPGLSTAENVTEISGRGVGLDVVKRSIEELRGRIEVATVPGGGTKFTLRLPLTTAIIDAMSVCVGRQQYLLPTVVIQRSFRPEPGSVSSIAGRGEMVLLHGQVLPLFRLHRLFGVDGAQQDPQQALLVVIEGAGRRCAVMVDELLGQQQAVMKSLGNTLSNVLGVTGGAILSDGRVGLILDAAGIVQLAHGAHEGVRPAAAAKLSTSRLSTELTNSTFQQVPRG